MKINEDLRLTATESLPLRPETDDGPVAVLRGQTKHVSLTKLAGGARQGRLLINYGGELICRIGAHVAEQNYVGGRKLYLARVLGVQVLK